MKQNKKNWILEEIEKKNECLDADSFGGENPEDVEKQREKNDKEINKRFTGTKKNADKVVGDDHEEKGKPMKEYLESKKDLSELLTELKEQNIHYTISRSDIDSYRYIVEYYIDKKSFNYKNARVQFNEGKYMIHFSNGEILEAKNRKEARNLIESKFNTNEKMTLNEEDLPDAIPDEAIVISTEPTPEDVIQTEPSEVVEENGIYMALSSELRDTLLDVENLKSLTVTLADAGDDEVIEILNNMIDDRTIHIGLLQGLMDKVDSKIEATEVNDEDEIVDDEEEVKQESLNEDRENDDNGESDLPNKVNLDKPNEADYEGVSEDAISDLEIMPYGEVTKEQWEDFLHKAKFPYWLNWEMLINEINGGVTWGSIIEECIKNINEDKLQERGFYYRAVGYDDRNREVAWAYSYSQGSAEAQAKAMKEKGTKGTIKSVVYTFSGNEPLATF